MTDLNHPIKKIKLAVLSEESIRKRISPKQTLCRRREFVLKLNLEALNLQRVKRIKAFSWKLDSQDESEQEIEFQKRVSKMLSQALGFDKAIQKLFVSFLINCRQEDVLRFLPSLKRLKSLQKMALKIDDSDQISDTGIHCLTKNLPSLLSLKDISLEFASTKDITDIGLHDMSRALKKLPFLKKIFIELDVFTRISHKGLSKLNCSLNRLTKLEDICLRIGYRDMTYPGVWKMNFKRLGSLQKIILFFPETRLTDTGMFWMTQSLEGLPNLHTVKLEWWNCEQVSDFALLCIWKMMNSLPSLRAVTLVFSDCSKITDTGFIYMKTVLKNLHLIQKFHFEFSCCAEVTDMGILALCWALQKKFTGLQRLSIPFGGCSNITDRGVKEIIDCMNKLPDLCNVAMSFSTCEKITDISLNYIIQFLKSRVPLEKFKIHLIDMPGTTDGGKAKFEKEIENLKRQRPNLRIESCSEYIEEE